MQKWNATAKERTARCPSIAVYIQIEKDIGILEQLITDSDRKVQIIEVSWGKAVLPSEVIVLTGFPANQKANSSL